MIILDTNVVSVLMAQRPDPAVLRWVDQQPPVSLWTTSVSIFEIRTGLELLPAGRRRNALQEVFEATLAEDLQDRVLDFDSRAAHAAAAIAARRQRAGKNFDPRDTLIAGIATARRATIATRNMRHFVDLDVPVVSPWGP